MPEIINWEYKGKQPVHVYNNLHDVAYTPGDESLPKEYTVLAFKPPVTNDLFIANNGHLMNCDESFSEHNPRFVVKMADGYTTDRKTYGPYPIGPKAVHAVYRIKKSKQYAAALQARLMMTRLRPSLKIQLFDTYLSVKAGFGLSDIATINLYSTEFYINTTIHLEGDKV